MKKIQSQLEQIIDKTEQINHPSKESLILSIQELEAKDIENPKPEHIYKLNQIVDQFNTLLIQSIDFRKKSEEIKRSQKNLIAEFIHITESNDTLAIRTDIQLIIEEIEKENPNIEPLAELIQSNKLNSFPKENTKLQKILIKHQKKLSKFQNLKIEQIQVEITKSNFDLNEFIPKFIPKPTYKKTETFPVETQSTTPEVEIITTEEFTINPKLQAFLNTVFLVSSTLFFPGNGIYKDNTHTIENIETPHQISKTRSQENGKRQNTNLPLHDGSFAPKYVKIKGISKLRLTEVLNTFRLKNIGNSFEYTCTSELLDYLNEQNYQIENKTILLFTDDEGYFENQACKIDEATESMQKIATDSIIHSEELKDLQPSIIYYNQDQQLEVKKFEFQKTILVSSRRSKTESELIKTHGEYINLYDELINLNDASKLSNYPEIIDSLSKSLNQESNFNIFIANYPYNRDNYFFLNRDSKITENKTISFHNYEEHKELLIISIINTSYEINLNAIPSK
ncbi:hypothetical protein CL656_04550 [bacterium]|nr:hypothetical protein [bacterium]|tara:strand:+ start:1845 stop:3377 length:1533 start_codon:yes stop_codon:yes gene_type:complete